MGLDWLLTPRPDETTHHEHAPVFRAESLVRSSLPDTVTRTAYTNMSPLQMRDYAEQLHNELTTTTYDDDTERIVNDVIEWLEHWASRGHSVTVWY